MWKRRRFISPLTTSRITCPHWAQCQLAKPDLQKRQKDGCGFHFRDMIFQRIGLMEQKALLLDSASCNSLTNEVHSILLLLTQIGWGQTHWDETMPQISWTYAMNGFKGKNQYLELDQETNWQPVQLTEQWYNMGSFRSSKNCLYR